MWNIVKQNNPQWTKSVFYDLLEDEDPMAASALELALRDINLTTVNYNQLVEFKDCRNRRVNSSLAHRRTNGLTILWPLPRTIVKIIYRIDLNQISNPIELFVF